MGGCQSTPDAKDDISTQEVVKSAQIDREMDQLRVDQDRKIKLLLLGAGESGKSTVFKQMRILYGAARTDEDLRYFGTVVRANAIVCMRKLMTFLRKLELEEELFKESDEMEAAKDAENEDGVKRSLREAYEIVMKNVVDNPKGSAEAQDSDPTPVVPNDWIGNCKRAGVTAYNDSQLFLKYTDEIGILWESRVMKKLWSKRSQINVIDSHKEYLQDRKRITAPDYRPTNQDILLCRVRTTQVIMDRYNIDGVEFEIYDVGGQRSERRKWLDCFENVDAVIFVAALSEYDQNLAESKRTNRMVEALELFRSVCNNQAFENTSIMLFLNKKDLFAEKILTSNIVDQKPFSDYTGPPKDFDYGVLYFVEKFKECLMEDDFSENFIHVTMATDTNNMEFVLESTRTIMMQQNLMNSGFIQ